MCFPPTAAAGLSTRSLHDALPIYDRRRDCGAGAGRQPIHASPIREEEARRRHGSRAALPQGTLSVDQADRKSTRLNSSHLVISYAVFCLKKKKKQRISERRRAEVT